MAERTFIPAERFCLSVRDGTHDSPKPTLAGKKLITSKHIVDRHLNSEDAYLISELDFCRINERSRVDQWDVLITMIGTVGEPCLVREKPDFAIKNIGLFKSRSEWDGKWLYYHLCSEFAQQAIRERSAGTTQAYISLGALRKFPVPVPDSEAEKQAVSTVLGALDDKIDLNRRMSETLSATARAIFKDWFIDFGPTRAKVEGRAPYLAPALWALFPDRLDDDGKPEGWRTDPLLNHARLISGGTPKTENAEYWNGSVPWASAKDVSQCVDGFLIGTERSITERGLRESATRMIPRLSTVVVARGATTGRYCMFGREIAMNQTCYALASTYNRPFWLNCVFGSLVEAFVRTAHGSVFDTITTRTIESGRLTASPPVLLDAFEEYIHPLFMKVLLALEETRSLGQMGGLLLPKLMSGELRVREAERVVEAAL